jgi:xylan 1,4-beta-xylosidase
VANLPEGNYWLEVRQTGYRVNDAYTTYLDMGAPAQLSRAQTDALLQGVSGAPVQQGMVKHPGGLFSKDLPLRQNDVLLVVLRKL